MRLRVVLLIVVLALAGTITLDRISPASTPARGTITFDPEGGVLTCPYLTEPGGGASIQLANLGSSTASVRILIPVQKGRPVSASVSLAPNSVKTVPVPAKVKGRSGAVIEYAGSTVVASHVLYLRANKGPRARATGISVAPCQGTGTGDVVVAFAGTLKSDATLALFNPGSAGADVSVTLLADGRTIEPVRLARRLVPSHSRRDFRLGDFAFNTRNLSAIVHANAGRVAAELLLRSNAGAELLPAQMPSNELIAVAGKSGDFSSVATTVVGADDTGFSARLITAALQRSAHGFPPSLPPGGGRILGIPAQGTSRSEAAFALTVDVGSPMVAATRWLVRGPGGNSELASLPAVQAARRWGGVIGGVGRFAIERLILVNPGSNSVTARLLTISPKGASQPKDVTIPPGRLVVVALGEGTGPVAFLLEADGPIAVAVKSTAVATSTGSTTATAAMAIPLAAPRPEAVLLDPRAGLPAVLPTR